MSLPVISIFINVLFVTLGIPEIFFLNLLLFQLLWSFIAIIFHSTESLLFLNHLLLWFVYLFIYLFFIFLFFFFYYINAYPFYSFILCMYLCTCIENVCTVFAICPNGFLFANKRILLI